VELSSTIILGIDPGTNVMGFGVIEIINNKIRLIDLGVVNFKSKKNTYEKLGGIFKESRQLINQYKPNVLAIESPFFGKNIQSMLKLGRAQGVVIATAMASNVEVFEYSPRKIKQSITGKGNADKERVAAMLPFILNIKIKPSKLDATDALATAVCHRLQSSQPKTQGKKFSNWGQFLKEHPEKLIETK
jgi:crossover junction endodeoxyribonuclease RuvC